MIAKKDVLLLLIKWIAPAIATSVLVGVTDPYFDLTLNGVYHKQQLLRPPAGRQYSMLISQQPLDRSLPTFQQLLLMSNEGKVENFS